VDDTVSGILALAGSDHPGPMNIGNPEEMSVRVLAERIRGLAGSSSPIVFVDRPVDDPGVRRPNGSLAESVLGWRPRVSWEDGLRRTIKWVGECLAAA
jgi:dTDP-glucose 4,6-dehydratase